MKRGKRLALSAVTGLAAAALAFAAVEGVRADAARAEQEALARYGGDRVAVCVTTRDIDPGEEIDEGNVEVVEWVSSLLPVDAVMSIEDAAGKTSTSRIPAGAPLSSAYFERDADAADVPRGKVAVSVASDAEHAVGGALERGEAVDVYVSKDARADRLTQADVLDTSALATGGGDVSWVTLAVAPSAVKELLAASSAGMVWLVVPGTGADGSDGSEVGADDSAMGEPRKEDAGDAVRDGGARDSAGDAGDGGVDDGDPNAPTSTSEEDADSSDGAARSVESPNDGTRKAGEES